MESMMKKSITRQQAGELKKRMRDLSSLSYQSFDTRRETEFRSFLITSLMDLQTEITSKERANHYVDLNKAYERVMDMIEKEIDYVNSVNEINEKLGKDRERSSAPSVKIPQRESF